jgi:galactokinase/mevalonate kinase-like predicted kinase
MERPKGFPVYHWNGTPPIHHLEPLSKAHSALNEALEALCDATPNMRDYYVLPNGLEEFDAAMQRHGEMKRKLGEVMQYIRELSEWACMNEEVRR